MRPSGSADKPASVSVGIILYEALRQRRQTGYSSSLSPEEFEAYKTKWLKRNHE